MKYWAPVLQGREGPKYLAIADAIAADVAAGRLAPGDRLPPQRDLAGRLALDFTTVARGYVECMCMRPSVCCCLWLAPINVWRVRPSPSGICNDHPDEYRRPRIIRDAGRGAGSSRRRGAQCGTRRHHPEEA